MTFKSRYDSLEQFQYMYSVIAFISDKKSLKEDKVSTIKRALEDGIITEDEAVELAVVFC